MLVGSVCSLSLSPLERQSRINCSLVRDSLSLGSVHLCISQILMLRVANFSLLAAQTWRKPPGLFLVQSSFVLQLSQSLFCFYFKTNVKILLLLIALHLLDQLPLSTASLTIFLCFVSLCHFSWSSKKGKEKTRIPFSTVTVGHTPTTARLIVTASFQVVLTLVTYWGTRTLAGNFTVPKLWMP